jgi:hypothetical protein
MTDLPQWREDEPGVWKCDDPDEMTFALVAMMVYGFDVVGMDHWLGRLEDCPARDQILEWRRQAKAGSLVSGPHVTMKPLLELMLIRRYTIDREGFLLPLAKRADAAKKKPGDVGRVTRYLQDERRPDETPRQLWDRLRDSLNSWDDAPIYFDGDEMYDATTVPAKEISFAAFSKRLNRG